MRVPLLLLALGAAAVPAPAAVPTPSEFLGFTLGADRKLADYRQIVAYLKALDAASPRVELQSLGPTTLGEDMVMAVISSEANIRNLARIREASRRLADPRGLTEQEAAALVADGKAVVLVTCNIHSTEIGASQMALEWAHALATAEDAETRRRLEAVVVLLVPSLNPDGQIMETEWYRQHLGSRFEGGRMPWLYHHYTGHDDNRDWFMLTQKETRAMNRAVYREWFPQVWLDEHQMGATGPRIFVPPFADPVSTEIHPLVWRDVNLIGALMALRLEQAGKSGVIYGFSYDAYWPGGTMNTAWWKNISGLLTEVASARLATPVDVAPGELSGGRKGLIDYGPQTNFPNPWPGGTWRLRDIMDYERLASDALLEAAADHRADLLRNALVRARAALAAFQPRDAYRIPAAQRDAASAQRLAQLVAEHGAEVRMDAAGDVWVPLAQPYGRFVREMFEVQRYPEVRLVAGREIVRPYDVSAWTLPLMMGVTVERAALPEGLKPYAAAPPSVPTGGAAYALVPAGPEEARLVNAALRGGGRVVAARTEVRAGDAAWPAGTVFLDGAAARAAAAKAVPGQRWKAVPSLPAGAALSAPRVGLYKPWAASMDEGWTRFLLEQYGFDPKPLDNKAVQKGGLRESFDAIVLPDVPKEVMGTGKPRREEGEMRYFAELPAEYAGGLDKDGAKGLRDFVEAGGTLVAMAGSCEYVIDELSLPVRSSLSRARAEEFSVTGSLLAVDVVGGHPVTAGLPSRLAVFQDRGLAFETALPGAEMQRQVLASYPAHEQDILLSGWINGADRLERRAAAVALTYGKGRVVLLGFRPQHRAQTPATFPFLFNALFWAASAGDR
jgi:zinc carboxypeptidase